MWKKPTLLLSILALSCSVEGGFYKRKEQKAPLECGITPHPYRATVRHIEGKGVGYNQGYTSLDLFLAPAPTLTHAWLPFAEGRLHIFNNGRIATNAGLGIRYLSPSFVYGVHTYYDYRETHEKKYNQIGLGFEALGKVFDYRLNGYLPVGGKKNGAYGGGPSFGFFSGHHLYLNHQEQMALWGLNSEVGIHIKKMEKMEFYGAFGPYYFGRGSQHAPGGKIRLVGTFLDHIQLEASTSYDPIFRWIGQGELSFIFPFGPKKKLLRSQKQTCSSQLRMHKRALQKIDRNEIIVLSSRSISQIAINPFTLAPYEFVFVDNTSHSLGTFESPYPTLIEAQENSAPYDIIYVFPGNGMITGMKQGILLQDHQKLLGSGISHPLLTTVGTVLLPNLTTHNPTISNVSDSVVVLGNHNEVAGMNIIGDNVEYGISGGDLVGGSQTIDSATIRSNSFELQSSFAIAVLARGDLSILNNTITTENTGGIHVGAPDSSNLYAEIAHNTVIGHGTSIPLELNAEDNGSFFASIHDNQLISTGTAAFTIFIEALDSSTFNLQLDSNTISSTGPDSRPLHGTAEEGEVVATINNNTITSAGDGIFFQSSGSGSMALDLSLNHLQALSIAMEMIASDTSSMTGLLRYNQAISSTNTAILLHTENTADATFVCLGNQAQGASAYLGIGLTAANASNLCTQLNNNYGAPEILIRGYDTSNVIYNTEDSSNNVPVPTVINVSPGSCD